MEDEIVTLKRTGNGYCVSQKLKKSCFKIYFNASTTEINISKPSLNEISKILSEKKIVIPNYDETKNFGEITPSIDPFCFADGNKRFKIKCQNVSIVESKANVRISEVK